MPKDRKLKIVYNIFFLILLLDYTSLITIIEIKAQLPNFGSWFIPNKKKQ
jgi:hypothetical protein